MRIRERLGWIGLVLLLAPFPVAAQDSDVQSLISAVAAERQRIAELQAEMDRRRTALDEISRRLESLAPAAALPVVATPAKAETPPPPRFDFYGETVTRFDNLRQSYDGCANCAMRTRGRFRIRFGTEGRLAPGLRTVIGFGVGELNDPNTTYQSLGGNFSRKVATWDRAYIDYTPTKAKWVQVTAGKFPYTWLRSSMTFDVDLFPEGLSEKFSFDLKRTGILKNVSLQGMQLVVNEQPAGADALVVGGQGAVRVRPANRLTTTVAFTEMDFKRPEYLLRSQLTGANLGTRNTNAVVTNAGEAFYASRFRYANVIVENAIQTGMEAMPLTVGFEYHENLRAISPRKTAQSFRLDAGRRQQKGDWGFGLHIFRVEQDAIVSAFGESDWRAPSNVIQHRYQITRMLHPNVQAGFTWYRGRTLDSTLPGAVLAPGLTPGRRDPWASRMYFDAIYRF